MNKIYPCLWFDGNASEAADFYCRIFNNTTITSENNFVVTFESSGQKFMLLNGGPYFKINPSISLFVVFENENELDAAWNQLMEGGFELMPLGNYEWSQKYGWVQDKYGVNWQLSYGKYSDVGQKFTPSFMFTGEQNGRAEEAVNYYTSVFNDSKIVGILKYAKDDHDKEGNVKHAQFVLNGQVFMATESSHPHNFGFNEAFSIVVECDTQEEIDYYWNELTKGGEESQCGWLKDKFGVSWQIVPSVLEKLMLDPEKSQKVMDAFMKMKKFEIEKLYV